jgi:hypothetical protein
MSRHLANCMIRNLAGIREVHNLLIARAPCLDGTGQKDEKEFVTQPNPKPRLEYAIVAVPFHADAATHDELARNVNEKLNEGYELYGPPFFSEEMMYQAMTKPLPHE